MPELPEVETTRLSLLPRIKGKTIDRVELKREAIRFPITPGFAQRLTGRRITDIRRRAKYLLFDLDNGEVILAHLGMSGSFLVTLGNTHVLRKHDHVLLHLKGGNSVIFHDPRRFGIILLLKKGEEATHPLLAKLGPEPLSKDFSVKYLKDALSRRKGPIKPTLMDQQLVVGVGNIYASESLFLAAIHPTTPSHEVAEYSQVIIQSIQKSLNAALKSGGSSLRDFTSGTGEAGYFQHYFNVYERKGEPCVACGCEIESIVQAGRTTFFLPAMPSEKESKEKIGEKMSD